jgi:hypothetical protein
VSIDEFWTIVTQARADAIDPSDAEEVAAKTLALLTALPYDQIAALAQPLWDLRSLSYRWDLWGAAYQINGGCSDDGFEYFRGWLIAQGREVFERAVADPDTLAELPVIQREAVNGVCDLECESMYGVVWDAYAAVTGSMDLPLPVTGRYPDLGQMWDFDDDDEVRTRLPRLAALFDL